MAQQDGALPTLTIHYAQTLDGRIATRTGDSQWISSPDSLTFAHQLRASHRAIMVGVGTILADDPRLTVRRSQGESPKRVVVDSALRIPLDAKVFTDGESRTLIATTNRAPADRIEAVRSAGAEVIIAAADPDHCVDLHDLLQRLAQLGIDSILIEGGRRLITSALHAHLVDRLVVCIAPKIIGAGIEAVGDLNIHDLSQALTFAESSFSILGEDIIFDGRL